MTLESLEFRRPTVSKSSKKTKSIIVIGAIVLTIIVAFGVAAGLLLLRNKQTARAKYLN